MRHMLVIDGLCDAPGTLDWSALDRLCAGEARVDGTEKLSKKVRGEGVRLSAVIAQAKPRAAATHVMVRDDGEYRACLALDGEALAAVLAHRSDGQPLADEQGGPVRLLVPASDNACMSVKRVTRLTLLDHAEPDTVPRATTTLRSR
jgi:DMSO/TMAO reductase YedYZ molybdopterin-dependent catalytic subunit